MALVYHLARKQDWEIALNNGVYAPPSLKTEGFIHASPKEELIPSAQLHFPEESSLVILVISEKKVRQILKWEEGREGKLFPHIYGNIALERIENTYLLVRNEEGKWEWMQG